jgi:hypothetical protein
LQDLSHDIVGINSHASNGSGNPVTQQKRL